MAINPALQREAGELIAGRTEEVQDGLIGRVLNVVPAEGDRVRQGQVVVRLEDTDVRMRLIQAEGDARFAAKTAEEQVQAAQAHESRARTELSLMTKSVATAVTVAKARLAASEARLHLLKAGPRPQELARAEADSAVASTAVTRAENALAYAQRTRERKLLLLKKGFISQQEVDFAELNVSQAQANLESQRSQLRALEQTTSILKAGPRPEETAQVEAEIREAEENVRSAQGAEGQIEQKRQDLLAAQAELRQAKQSLQSLQWSSSSGSARMESANPARTRVELAREGWKRATIQAPLTGIVTLRKVEPGENVAVGSPLLEIVDPASLYVEAVLTDQNAVKVRAGQSVDLVMQAMPTQHFTGHILELVPPAASQGQGFRVKVALDSRAVQLRSGMLTTGFVHIGKHTSATILPAAALIADSPDASEGEVYLVVKEAVRHRHVRLGVRVGEKVEVLGGIREGDRVVIEGQAMLTDGQRVTVPSY